MIKIFLISFFFTCFNLSDSNCQTSDKFSSIDEDIRVLFEVNGSKTAYVSMIDNMVNILGKDKQEEPEWKAYSAIFRETSVDELIEMLIPIYKNNFTQQDIKDLIGFYQSPIGLKLASKSTMMTQESMNIGLKWGQEVHNRLKTQIKNKGYKLRLPFSGSY